MKRICSRRQTFKQEWWDQLVSTGLQSFWVKKNLAILVEDMKEGGLSLLQKPEAPQRNKAIFVKEMAAMSVQALFTIHGRSPKSAERDCT